MVRLLEMQVNIRNLYLETPLRLIETKVFSAMPAKFRRKGVASEWGDATSAL
jgi:hypothetical protein